MTVMLRLLLTLAIILGLTTAAGAGQGPQNTVVVINARSPLSVAIGHRYAHWRGIAPVNLIYLDCEGSPVGTDVETFRQKILRPIAKQLDERKLAAQVTTIAYSSDFPYLIDFKADLQEDSKVDRTAKQFHQGSLTGMTYLAAIVLAKDVSYSNLGVNFYYRPSLADKLLLETRSFPPDAAWNQAGDTTDTKGVRYLMSTMLAYTSGRGNSLAEVENYLQCSVAADGTYPAGKIYFLTNPDIRARTRAQSFAAAIARLEAFGIAAEVADGILPRDRGDVMGAMIGAVDYRFADSGSSVRGGAICENLTSFGGILRENGGQTALSECLRAGAAGSSGTVTEPFAIQAKFPHPMIHVHYAAGCSLAESFYQSVQGPYQLLIVGDPLCRPWATIPTIRVAGLPGRGAPARGTLALTPSAATVSDKRVGHYELYVDGLLHSRCADGDTLSVDTTAMTDGAHELRVVGYEASPIATQGEWRTRIVAANHGWRLPEVTIEPRATAASDSKVTVRAAAPGASALMLYHQQRLVGTINADQGAWTLPAAKLGLGPGVFQVLAMRGAGPANACVSAPLPLQVSLPPQRAAVALDGETKPGLRLVREGKDPVIVERLADDWIGKAGLDRGEPLRIESVFRVETEDIYQFQLEFGGDAELLVDGQPLFAAQHAQPAFAYIPVALAAGPHRLEIRATLDEARRLNAFFGNRGTQAVTNGLFHHVE